jgi:hypothetical protein
MLILGPKPLGRRLNRSLLTKVTGGGDGGGFDAAASAYIAAVETADGQTLEAGVKTAINDFVVGCKADGIWNSIKASCILAGARTLSGALVPLAGTAPTNNNFVSGDYNRKTGLAGNGSTKYLDSNRNNNADPQNNSHLCCYVSTGDPINSVYAGVGPATGESGVSNFGPIPPSSAFVRSKSATVSILSASPLPTGLFGISRATSTQHTSRINATTVTSTVTSETPYNGSIRFFSSTGTYFANARFAFYSIGESLDLALLDARVTTLIAAYATTIQVPSYANVSLLLHGDGTNGSTTITDNSPTPKTVTAVGTAQISTAQSKFGGASIAFDGTGDYLTAANNASLDFDSGDFTVECWLYFAGLQVANIDGQRVATLVAYGVYGVTNSGYSFNFNTTASQLFIGRPGTGAISAATFAPALSTWYHVAYTRSGSTNRLFVNGNLLTLTTDTFTPVSSATGTLRIGAERFYTGYSHDLNGYIDDLRITKGFACYTANFTPPTAPFPNS